MSAKKGWTQSFRLLSCLMAVALLASAVFASAASAKKTEPTVPTAYINLGDSVSFGYTAEKFDLNFPAEPASAFEGGAPNLLAAKLAKKEAKEGNKLSLINLACPGETSKGLIGNGPVAEALLEKSAETHFTGGEAPCAWHNEAGFPRHFEYGSVSQLEAAVGILTAAAKKEGPEVKDITLQIGSNDELHAVSSCKSATYRSEHGFGDELTCIVEEAKNVVFPTIITNIGNTIGVLRHAGYTGPIAVLGFFNPQALLLTGSDTLQAGLNEAMEANLPSFGPGVAYGNPFKKTNARGKKSLTTTERNTIEKEAICKYTEECNMFDKKIELEKAVKHEVTAAEVEALETPSTMTVPGDIHPTPAGDELFAKDLGKALKKA